MTDSVTAVTGASGFPGKRLCAALKEKGYKIRALLNDGEDTGYFEALGAQTHTGDVRDAGVAARLVDGAERVFHLAGVTSAVGTPDSVYWDRHVTATRTLLKAASGAGVRRLVYYSTAGVTGDVKDPPSDESADYSSNDIYDITKAHGEKTALASNGKGGMETVVVRPTVLYGPGDMRRLAFFRKIVNGTFKMIGSGDTLVHPVYVDDAVEGMILACQSDKAAGKIYIIGGAEYLTLNEWVRIIAEAAGVDPPSARLPYYPVKAVSAVCEKLFTWFGLEPPLFRRKADFFIKNRAYKIDRAREDLGYSPKVGLEEGARRTIEWYRAEGLL